MTVKDSYIVQRAPNHTITQNMVSSVASHLSRFLWYTMRNSFVSSAFTMKLLWANMLQQVQVSVYLYHGHLLTTIIICLYLLSIMTGYYMHAYDLYLETAHILWRTNCHYQYKHSKLLSVSLSRLKTSLLMCDRLLYDMSLPELEDYSLRHTKKVLV